MNKHFATAGLIAGVAVVAVATADGTCVTCRAVDAASKVGAMVAGMVIGPAQAQQDQAIRAEPAVALEVFASGQRIVLEFWPDARSCDYAMAPALLKARGDHKDEVLKAQCSRNGIPVARTRVEWPPGGAPTYPDAGDGEKDSIYPDVLSRATRQHVERLQRNFERDLSAALASQGTSEAEPDPAATFAPAWPAWAEKVQQAIDPNCPAPNGAVYNGCQVTLQLQHKVNGQCSYEGAPRIIYDACWFKKKD